MCQSEIFGRRLRKYTLANMSIGKVGSSVGKGHTTRQLKNTALLRDLVDPSVDPSVGKVGWSVDEDTPADVSVGKVGSSVGKNARHAN